MSIKTKIPFVTLVAVAAVAAGAFLLFPSVSNANECRSANPSWYQCQADSDCEMISDPCGWPTVASSSQHAEEAKRCNSIAGEALDCVTYNPAVMGVFTPKCQAGVCVTVKSD